MDVEQITALAIWITMLPYLGIMVLFYQNRFVHPIRGRYPRIALLELFAIFLFGTNQTFYMLFGPQSYNCVFYDMFLFLISCAIQFGINYRLVQLLFSYELTQNIAELKEKKDLKDWKPNWFTTHRWLAKNKFIAQVAAGLAFIYTIICIAYLEGSSVSICSKQSSWGNMFAVKGAVGAVFSIIVAVKMRKFGADAFGLKKEFKWRTGTPITITIVSSLLSAISPGLSWLIDVALVLACHPLLYFALIPPYLASRQELALRTVTGLQELSSLDNWLKRPDGIRYFLSYLKTEFSSENLLFYLDVVYFKNLPRADIPGLKYHCEQIFNKFLDTMAPGQVNISFEINEITAKNVQTFLNATPETIQSMKDEEIFSIFDHAQTEIYRLMSADSFHRFQRTSEFEKVKNAVLKQTSIAPGGHGDSKSVDQVLGSQDVLKVLAAARDEDLDNSFRPLSRSHSEPESPRAKGSQQDGGSYCALIKPEDGGSPGSPVKHVLSSSQITYSQLPQVDSPESPKGTHSPEISTANDVDPHEIEMDVH